MLIRNSQFSMWFPMIFISILLETLRSWAIEASWATSSKWQVQIASWTRPPSVCTNPSIELSRPLIIILMTFAATERHQHQLGYAVEAVEELQTKNKRLEKVLKKGDMTAFSLFLRVITHLLRVVKALLTLCFVFFQAIRNR